MLVSADNGLPANNGLPNARRGVKTSVGGRVDKRPSTGSDAIPIGLRIKVLGCLRATLIIPPTE